jgi:hypothetical protein
MWNSTVGAIGAAEAMLTETTVREGAHLRGKEREQQLCTSQPITNVFPKKTLAFASQQNFGMPIQLADLVSIATARPFISPNSDHADH